MNVKTLFIGGFLGDLVKRVCTSIPSLTNLTRVYTLFQLLVGVGLGQISKTTHFTKSVKSMCTYTHDPQFYDGPHSLHILLKVQFYRSGFKSDIVIGEKSNNM